MVVAKTLLARSLLLEMFHPEDVATQGVSAKGCCYQRTTNVDTINVVAKGHHCTPKMLYEKLLPN